MSNSKPGGSPVNSSLSYGNYEKSAPLSSAEHERYLSIVRSLLFLLIKTRPDLSVAAGMMASNVENPTLLQMSATKRILRYFRKTADEVMIMCPGKDDQLTACHDASWGANNQKNRRNGSGIMIGFEKIISATRNLQKSISLSFKGADYVALSHATKTISWLGQLSI